MKLDLFNNKVENINSIQDFKEFDSKILIYILKNLIKSLKMLIYG